MLHKNFKTFPWNEKRMEKLLSWNSLISKSKSSCWTCNDMTWIQIYRSDTRTINVFKWVRQETKSYQCCSHVTLQHSNKKKKNSFWLYYFLKIMSYPSVIRANCVGKSWSQILPFEIAVLLGPMFQRVHYTDLELWLLLSFPFLSQDRKTFRILVCDNRTYNKNAFNRKLVLEKMKEYSFEASVSCDLKHWYCKWY